MEREGFLGRLTEILGPREGRAAPPPLFNPPQELFFQDVRERLRVFVEQSMAAGQPVHLVKNRAGAYAGLRKLLDAKGFSRVCGEQELLGDIGSGYLASAPETADFGLCRADYGLAETGTLVLLPGGERLRSFSLLPYAVGFFLAQSALFSRLTELLPVLEGLGSELPACVNLITGPSRTADIELDLCIGVHGPAETHVWVIEDE